MWNSGNVDVRVWNSRQKEVKNVKYETPIRFEFEGRKVVSLAGLETEPAEDVIEPEDLKIYLMQETRLTSTDYVELPDCLLKPNQSISLTLLLTGLLSRTIRRGKLVDGKIIKFDPEAQNLKKRKTNLIAYPIIFSIMLFSVICLIYFDITIKTNPFLFLFLSVIGLFSIFSYFYLRYFNKS